VEESEYYEYSTEESDESNFRQECEMKVDAENATLNEPSNFPSTWTINDQAKKKKIASRGTQEPCGGDQVRFNSNASE